jgi:sugar transferase (PEP-CTERM system associated)
MIRIFKQHLRIPFLFLGIAEFVTLALSVSIASSVLLIIIGNIYVYDAFLPRISSLLPGSLIISIAMFICLVSMGLYSTDHLPLSKISVLLRVFASYIAGIVTLTLILLLFPTLTLGHDELVFSLLISFGLIVVGRLIFTDVVDRNRLKRRLLVYGSGNRASHISKLIEENSVKSDMKVLGYIHAEGEQDAIAPLMVRHLNEPLVRFAKKRRVSEIVVAVDDRRKTLPVDQLLECRLRGIEVIDLNCFFERETRKLRVDLITPSWMTFSDGFIRGAFREYLKRGFDISASLLLLAITWPIMLLTALAILLESGWGSTVLYRQTRVGRAQKLFEVLKFRSMIENAEQNVGARWAEKNDDRVTRVGAIIRKYRIDELPQILNVLRGKMSFVGPRPERPEFVKVLGKKIPYYVKRNYVKPGITGWAQLRYPYGDSDKDAMEKLQYDLYYVKNYSLVFDLVILLQTVEVVLFGKGAR